MDAGFFLNTGVIMLAFSLVIFLALWTAQLSDSILLGTVVGTGIFMILYFGATLLSLELLVVSPIAVGLSAIAVVLASITANVEVSRAEI